MPVTPSFSAQDCITAARARHIALSAVAKFPSDASLLPDFNQFVVELVGAIITDPLRARALRQQLASIAAGFPVVDGSVLDLNPPEGQVLRVIDADATRAGVTRRVVFRDIRHRDTLADEYADDPRPIACVQYSGVNNRYELFCAANWSDVTAIRPWAVIKPTTVVIGTIGQQVLLPVQCQQPIVEMLANLLGHSANLNEEWTAGQAQLVKTAQDGCFAALAAAATAEMAETGMA